MRWQRAMDGDMSDYISVPGAISAAQSNSLLDNSDLVAALLLASPPTTGDSTMDGLLANAVGLAVPSLLRSGMVLLKLSEDRLDAVPGDELWPLAGVDGWLTVTPGISLGSGETNGRNDLVTVTAIADGVEMSAVREWKQSGTDRLVGQLGAVVDVGDSRPVAVEAVARTPRLTSGWGSSAIPKLLPTAVAIWRREAGLDYVLDYNERPITQFPMSTQPQVITQALTDTLEDADVDAKTLRELMPALGEQDILALPPGMEPGEMLERMGDMNASFDSMDRLERKFADGTGFSPTESGDSGHMAAGVTIARRNARGTVLTRGTVFMPLLRALQVLLPAVQWEWVGDAQEPSDGLDAPEGAF